MRTVRRPSRRSLSQLSVAVGRVLRSFVLGEVAITPTIKRAKTKRGFSTQRSNAALGLCRGAYFPATSTLNR